ncbi:HAMP domain-containing sensor histidine kinase [Ectobacillus ponti]|uniref:histidine kinase n=1 Tax=Ectobacillus ponti TaxID=2961894 RepID=A0AA41X5W7_9BACI|nr:HAMP domain-containing sensor histidine kinase [Ectobacillus ponti]MCP8969262.1 HAMP domain-containing histidine kinase [Ectobacillus ponti]
MKKQVAHILRLIRKLLSTKLNIRIIAIFIVCFSGATASFVLIASKNPIISQTADYQKKEEWLHQVVSNIGGELERRQLRSDDAEQIAKIVEQYKDARMQVAVAGEKESVVLTTGGEEQKIEVRSLLLNGLGFFTEDLPAGNPLIAIYPVSFQDEVKYIVAVSPHKVASISPRQYNQNALLTMVGAIVVFLVLFFLFMRPITRYIKEIETGIRKIVQEDLSYGIRVKGKNELSSLAANINWMAQQLKERFQRERELEQSKNELITNISHDLRTPLTSIIGYTGLLKDGHYEDEQELRHYLQITYTLSEKLKNQIQELFEYTKLVSPDMQLEYEDMDLGGLLRQFAGEYIPIFKESGLQLELLIPEHPVLVQLDTEKFVRVLDNVLSNAEKYSYKPSKVTVQLQQQKDTAKISVTNETNHIPEDMLPKLFQRLYRLDTSRSQSIEGSGIGLAAVKRIVELHKGNVWAESKQDDITVHIVLPLASGLPAGHI